MQKELKDSIKARLYDFKYTPFLSAYLFSWIFWNSKLILIFTDSKLTVQNKIDMLSWSDINYWYPLYFALFYVILFPIATTIFYAITLAYKALMNKIQQIIQDKTPLPLEQANEIREENVRLALEYQGIREELEKIKIDYTSKESTLNTQFIEQKDHLEQKYEKKNTDLETYVSEEVEKQTKVLNDLLSTSYTVNDQKSIELKAKQELINKLESQIADLEIKVSTLSPVTKEKTIIDNAYKKAKTSKDNVIAKLTIEHIKMLATFFNNDSMITEISFKNYVNKEFGLSKTLVDLRIEELNKFSFTKINSNNFFYVTDRGKKVIEEIFT